MSRDLGTNQTRLLRALAALEREHDTGSRFYVWAVIEQVYKDPPDLQEIEKRQQECVAADRQWWEDLAASGNDQAKRYLALGRPLRRTRRSPQWRRKFPSWVEDTLIPSRVLASLEARGLVKRRAIKGGESVQLTDAGREVAVSGGTSLRQRLSVGSTCPSSGYAC